MSFGSCSATLGMLGDVAGARRHHHALRPPFAPVGLDHIAAVGLAQAGDGGVGLDRRRDHSSVTVEERDRLGHVPVAVRVVALVAEARQAALPVRRQQPERLPALGAPGVGDLAALQHHVVERAIGQAPAHGEPGVPGADHDGGDYYERFRIPRRRGSAAQCHGDGHVGRVGDDIVTPPSASATGRPAPRCPRGLRRHRCCR